MRFDIFKTSSTWDNPEVDGAIRKVVEPKIWQAAHYIQIDTLEDLMKIVRKHHEIVLTEDSIEIYDAYRE